MKKLLFSLLSLSLLLMTSCKTKSAKDYYDVSWKSEIPQIEFNVPPQEDFINNQGYNEGVITIGETQIGIWCLWTNYDGLDVFYKDKVEYLQNDLYEEDIAFNGSVKSYKNKFVLTIGIDNVFAEQYKEITFYKTEL